MTDETNWPDSPEWFDDARGERRWPEALTVLARVGESECLGKTQDVSLTGLGAVLHGMLPAAGDLIELDVLFGSEICGFQGKVVRSESRPEGSLVGIRLQRPDAVLLDFLKTRYLSSFGGSGTVA